MLKKYPDHNYIVYPSWATPQYRWEDLPTLLADPIASGYLEPGRSPEYYRGLGYPEVPQPFTLTDGPCGGGIILWEGDPRNDRGGRWLPIKVLRSWADIRYPPGMDLICSTFDAEVSALETNGAGVPFLRQKLYTCAASTEHAESAGDAVYWILCAEDGKRAIKGLESLPGWAAGFGLDVVPLANVPDAVQSETKPWFLKPTRSQIWFGVNGGGDEVGFQFAILVYIAYHLRKVAGQRVFSMHLVANIEGKPNARRLWNE